MVREKSYLECAGLTALCFPIGSLESGVKPPHSKEPPLYTILLTKRQQRCIVSQLKSWPALTDHLTSFVSQPFLRAATSCASARPKGATSSLSQKKRC